MNITIPRRSLVAAPPLMALAAMVMFAAPAHASDTGPGHGTGPNAIVISDPGGDGPGPKAVDCPGDPPIIRR